MAPPRPLLYLPPLLLHAPHRPRMGHHLHHQLRRHYSPHAAFCFRTLPREFAGGGYGELFLGGEVIGPWGQGVAREEEGGVVWETGGGRGGGIGVWVLL